MILTWTQYICKNRFFFKLNFVMLILLLIESLFDFFMIESKIIHKLFLFTQFFYNDNDIKVFTICKIQMYVHDVCTWCMYVLIQYNEYMKL